METRDAGKQNSPLVTKKDAAQNVNGADDKSLRSPEIGKDKETRQWMEGTIAL